MTGTDYEKTVIYSNDTRRESVVCPFTQSKGKRAGNVLLVIMFILVPIMLLLYLILAS